MAVSFQGFGEQVATFLATDTVKKGDWVKISANGTVAPCAAGDAMCGKVLSVRGGTAAVQVGGYVSTPISGSLSLGRQAVTAGSATALKAAAASNTTAPYVLVVEVSEDSAGILL